MRRWRKRSGDDEELLTFEGLLGPEVDDDDEDEEKRPRRKYAAPRPIRTRFHGNDDYEDEPDGPTFDELEPMIRAGKYKPKQSDPWTAHLLYQALRDLGDI